MSDDRGRNMNPGVQARLLAFQHQRQRRAGSVSSDESAGAPVTPDLRELSIDEETLQDLSEADGAGDADEFLPRRTSFRLPKSKGSQDQASKKDHRQVSFAATTSSNDSGSSGESPTTSGGLSIATGAGTSPVQPATSTSSGRPKRGNSLSERRGGMKLNLGALNGSLNNGASGTSATSTLPPIRTGDSVQATSPLSSSVSRSGSVSTLSTPGSASASAPGSRGAGAGAEPGSLAPTAVSAFTPFAKYVDIKSGSLNFAGKASVHSKGIDFSNGASFRISMDDLEVLEELGRGNYGVVSKVLHKPTGIIMAMKQVHLELDDAKFRQILMELEVLHNCLSECIVDFYGAFFVEGAVYMCMEYMQGHSLDCVYGDGIGEPELAYITKQVIRGLKKLKDEHNIIHRDVKPTNILVNSEGKVKLCDFGVSGNLVASLARTNIGCQSYMAPERIKSTRPDANTYSVQSDIWSLGLSVLEVAKGRYPYPPETYGNIFSQLSAIVDGEPPELDADKFSPEARDFVQKCLAKDPDDRPTYAELLEHPWLKNVDEKAGQEGMARIVADSKKKDRKKAGRAPTPSLHRVELNKISP